MVAGKNWVKSWEVVVVVGRFACWLRVRRAWSVVWWFVSW